MSSGDRQECDTTKMNMIEWIRSIVSQLIKTPQGIIALIALMCLVAVFWIGREGLEITRSIAERFIESNDATNKEVRIAVAAQSQTLTRIADMESETMQMARDGQRFQIATESIHARQDAILSQLTVTAQRTLELFQGSDDRDRKIEDLLTTLIQCIEDEKKRADQTINEN